MTKVKITLPKLGESVAEATITAWLKQPGDKVEKDETLCEIGTDKVESELPSEYSGVIEQLLFSEGDIVKVGEAIAVISTTDELGSLSGAEVTSDESLTTNNVTKNIKPEGSLSGAEVTPKELMTNNNQPKTTYIESKSSLSEADGKEQSNSIDKESSVGFLTPVVRKMMVENNLEIDELATIKGSGQNARVTKKDVEDYLRRKAASKESHLAVPQKLDLPIETGDEVKELSRRRKILSSHLQRASQLIPHVTTFIEIDVSTMVDFREKNKVSFQEKVGEKLTYTHFLQYAVIQSLRAYPQLNSWLNEDQWILKKDINLGFATALADGNLIVPNVKAVQNMSIPQLVRAINAKAKQAKSGKLQADDLVNTTFTMSNTGMFGSQMGTPIISIPQVAVLAMGQILRKPVVKQIDGKEEIVPAHVMTCSLSYDHRVIDGALASQFLTEVKKRIEAEQSPT